MLAALPTLAPSSCANAFGTRSAKLLPHFKNLTFMAGLLLARVTQALGKSDRNERKRMLEEDRESQLRSRFCRRSTQTRQSQYEFAFNGGLSVKTCGDGRLERVVIFGVLQRSDHRLGCEPMADGIAARALLAFFCDRTCTLASIAAVGLDLSERSHWDAAAFSIVLLTIRGSEVLYGRFVGNCRQRVCFQP